jgi:HEAT repeat protein
MGPEEQISFEDLTLELSDGSKTLVNARLVELSNIQTEDFELFKKAWIKIDAARRRQIMERLVELGEDNLELNFDVLFKYCLKDPDAEVRVFAIEGLWENEEPSLVNHFINMVDKDTSEEVQTAAAGALGKFAVLAEHKKIRDCYGQKIKESLLRILNNPLKNEELRRRALEAVSPLSLPEIKQSIKGAYNSKQHKLQVSSIYAMGKSSDSSWLPMLLEELNNEDVEIRYEAVVACGELEEEEAVPYLGKLIYSEDADIQLAAIEALGKIGGTQAKEYLQRCLHHPSEAVRETTKEVIADLKAKEAAFFPI